jgi:hypothetical protein
MEKKAMGGLPHPDSPTSPNVSPSGVKLTPSTL